MTRVCNQGKYVREAAISAAAIASAARYDTSSKPRKKIRERAVGRRAWEGQLKILKKSIRRAFISGQQKR